MVQEICAKCRHLVHMPMEKNGTNGCAVIVKISLERDGRFYHEHCPCDFKIHVVIQK